MADTDREPPGDPATAPTTVGPNLPRQVERNAREDSAGETVEQARGDADAQHRGERQDAEVDRDV